MAEDKPKPEQSLLQLIKWIRATNITDDIDKDTLGKLATQVCEDYTDDKTSMEEWERFVKEGKLENPDAWGGHSDALDWDRHLGHVSIIYDMLLPYILTDGALSDDDADIAESGNGIPDILDEARNEVDFWLRLRDGAGYSHGLTNPNRDNVLYQS